MSIRAVNFITPASRLLPDKDLSSILDDRCLPKWIRHGGNGAPPTLSDRELLTMLGGEDGAVCVSELDERDQAVSRFCKQPRRTLVCRWLKSMCFSNIGRSVRDEARGTKKVLVGVRDTIDDKYGTPKLRKRTVIVVTPMLVSQYLSASD